MDEPYVLVADDSDWTFDAWSTPVIEWKGGRLGWQLWYMDEEGDPEQQSLSSRDKANALEEARMYLLERRRTLVLDQLSRRGYLTELRSLVDKYEAAVERTIGLAAVRGQNDNGVPLVVPADDTELREAVDRELSAKAAIRSVLWSGPPL